MNSNGARALARALRRLHMERNAHVCGKRRVGNVMRPNGDDCRRPEALRQENYHNIFDRWYRNDTPKVPTDAVGEMQIKTGAEIEADRLHE